MKKGIIIIGEGPCGKSFLARIIARCFAHYYVFDCHDFKPDLTQLQKTDCVIFEGVKIENIDEFFNYVTNGIPIGKGEVIRPTIIITCNENPVNLSGASLFTRFDILCPRNFQTLKG